MDEQIIKKILKRAVQNHAEYKNFCEDIKIHLGTKFTTLSHLCHNYNIQVDLKEELKPVVEDIRHQAEKQYHIEIPRTIFVHDYLTHFASKKAQKSFHDAYKSWCHQTVEGLNDIKKRHSWFDAHGVMKKLLAIDIHE